NYLIYRGRRISPGSPARPHRDRSCASSSRRIRPRGDRLSWRLARPRPCPILNSSRTSCLCGRSNHSRGFCARAARPRLIPLSARITIDADFEKITRGPVLIDLGLAKELEPRLLNRARADVSVALRTVVPQSDLFVHPSGNHQADFATAFTRRRRLQLCDAVLEIGAAVATKISSCSRHCPACDERRGCAKQPKFSNTRNPLHYLQTPRYEVDFFYLSY